jgi:serpin B
VTDSADVRTYIDDTQAFAIAVDRVLNAEGNLAWSPHGLGTVLTMLWAGTGGASARELGDALRLKLPPERAHRAAAHVRLRLAEYRDSLRAASAVWTQTGLPIESSFTRVVQEQYAASLATLDFVAAPDGARETINAWAATHTAGRVTHLIPAGSIDTQTRLVLTNAIHFRAPWHVRFAVADTQPAAFTTRSGRVVQVPMMSLMTELAYTSGPGFAMVELPYAGNNLALVCLVRDGTAPAQPNQTDLSLLLENIAQLQPQRVIVTLPRFVVSARLSFVDVLRRLGVKTLFTADADLSGISSQRGLAVSSILQKAVIDVNEEGTEAAAASAAVIGIISEPPRFRADRPFVFVLRDRRDGALLFIGRVEDPSARPD